MHAVIAVYKWAHFGKGLMGRLGVDLGHHWFFLWKGFTVPFKVIARNFRNSN